MIRQIYIATGTLLIGLTISWSYARLNSNSRNIGPGTRPSPLASIDEGFPESQGRMARNPSSALITDQGTRPHSARIALSKEEIEAELRHFGNPEYRNKALDRLLEMNAASVRTLATVIHDTKDPLEKLRALELVRTLDYSAFPEVKPVLTQVLASVVESGDPLQVRDALNALGVAGDGSSVPVLQSYLGHVNSDIYLISLTSLAQVTKSIESPDARAEVAESIVQQWVNATTRADGSSEKIAEASAKALGQIRSPIAANYLLSQLDTPHDMQTQVQIVIALGNIQSPTALPALSGYLGHLQNLAGRADESIVAAQINAAIAHTNSAIAHISNRK